MTLKTNKTEKGKYNIMNALKKHLTKDCVKRALRTFLQTAVGYVVTNISLYVGGIDYTNGDVLKNAFIGLAVSAISAGLAAVMNLGEGAYKNNG